MFPPKRTPTPKIRSDFLAAENEVSAALVVNYIAQRLLNKYPSIRKVSESGYSTLERAH